MTPPHRRRKFGPFPFIAVAPAIVLVLAIMVFPIGSTIYHSFTSWDGTTTRFIGIENFRLLWHTACCVEVLVNSLIFLISVPVILLASLIAAVLVYEQVLGWRLFRVLFFVPAVLSPVVVGALFSTFVLPNGLANEPLRLLGIPPDRLAGAGLAGSDRRHGCFGVDLVRVRHDDHTGRHGDNRPGTVRGGRDRRRFMVEAAAQCHGPARVGFVAVPVGDQRDLHVHRVVLVFVFVITGGGPGFATTTIDYYTYVTTFENGQFGYGSALAVVLFVIVALLTVAQLKLFPQRAAQHGV